MKVIDEKHGIETQYLGVGQGYQYLPYYFKGGHSYYYTQGNNSRRVAYPTYGQAYNHIARSRRLHTLPYRVESH